MSTVVDFHVHVFPDWIGKVLQSGSNGSVAELVSQRVDQFRKTGRIWKKPVSASIHRAMTFTRLLPDAVRKNLDQFGAWVPIPSLLLESTVRDLEDALEEAGVDSAVVIAHPPLISNEFILEVCSGRSNWIPAVNIPKQIENPAATLKSFVRQGAKILKIHPSLDGEGAKSARYRKLLRTADDLGLPVIIHTGCIHSNLLFRKPDLGEVTEFTEWFETYRNVRFVLAHMNYHEPQAALDLCEEFPNLWVDTSWQPVEVIGEAVRQIGAERVLFGTDWPILGDNIRVGKERIFKGVSTGLLNPKQAELILGGNAVKLLGLNLDAAKTESAHRTAT